MDFLQLQFMVIEHSRQVECIAGQSFLLWTMENSISAPAFFCVFLMLLKNFFSFSTGNNFLQLLACFHYSVLFSWTPFLLHFSSSPWPSINFVPIVDVNIWATVLWEPSNNDWLLKYLILETDLIPRKLASWQCQGAVLHVHYFINHKWLVLWW